MGLDGSQLRRARPLRHRSAPDELLDQWVAQLEAEAPPASEPPTESGAASAEALKWPLQLDGRVARFTDATGGTVVLGRVGGCYVHRGALAGRGPLGLHDDDWQTLGLTAAERRALDFVIGWFGAPFDAVNVGTTKEPLSFGVWSFAGPRLVETLTTFREAAPAAFATLLGAFGIGVDAGALTFAAPRTPPRSGPAAASAIATNAAASAALARAGRDRAAMRAQLSTLTRSMLRPALGLPAGQQTLGAVLRSPRALALIAWTDLTFGAAGPARLAHDASAGGGEAAALERTCARLRVSRIGQLGTVLRILHSPELADV